MTLEEIKEITVNMKNDATNVYRLLENLLEWSRFKRGVMEFNPVQTDLKTEVESVIGVIYDLSVKKEILITNFIPGSIPISVDRNMFGSILRNVVSNAVKFTPRGGTIGLNASILSNGQVEIRIKDSGIGIPPEILKKLFLIDEKTNRNGTEGEPSTGLGLLLCKEFVEKHGGTIAAQSSGGLGTTFIITI
jgi:signal transduction histidine kinase